MRKAARDRTERIRSRPDHLGSGSGDPRYGAEEACEKCDELGKLVPEVVREG